MVEKCIADLFIAAAREETQIPGWMVRLYLALFEPPLGKTIRIDLIKDLLKGHDFRDQRVLDVGCGSGDLSLLLARRGANVLGVELDTTKVARASRIACEHGLRQARFIAGDVTRLNELDLGTFDVIFCLALLEHIQDDVALLRQLHNMLRPGGLFVMEVPNARRRTIPEVEAEDGHMRPGYVYEDVSTFLAAQGLRVLKQQTRDPLGLIYYWCAGARIIPSRQARGRLFAVLAPIFIPLIRLSSLFLKRPGSELAFVAVRD